MDDLTFRATIPPIQSAVKVGGDLAVRIQLDVPATDYDAAMDFIRQAAGRVVRVVAVIEEEG